MATIKTNNNISNEEVKKDKSLPFTITFKEIKTPTTVEEFRENLLKYYVSYGRNIMVGSNDKNIGDFCVDDIESMEDLGFYDGFQWNGSDFHSPTLHLTPTVVQIKDWEDYSNKNFMLYDGDMNMEELCVNWWLGEENTLIIDYKKMRKVIESDAETYGKYDFMKLCDKYMGNVYWKNFYKEGNSLYRDFYQKTLGLFGGRGEWLYDNNGVRIEKEVA